MTLQGRPVCVQLRATSRRSVDTPDCLVPSANTGPERPWIGWQGPLPLPSLPKQTACLSCLQPPGPPAQAPVPGRSSPPAPTESLSAREAQGQLLGQPLSTYPCNTLPPLLQVTPPERGGSGQVTRRRAGPCAGVRVRPLCLYTCCSLCQESHWVGDHLTCVSTSPQIPH